MCLQLPLDGFLWNLGTFTKICKETPNLVKIGQKYRALVHEDLGTFILLTVAGHTLYLGTIILLTVAGHSLYTDKSVKGTHCLSMATLNTFISQVNKSTHGKYCCVSMATMFTRTRRNITLRVHCLSCFRSYYVRWHKDLIQSSC
jgi:hypothetical protein